MKKAICILFVLFLFSFQSFSQIKPFRFGVKVAPNIAWISPDAETYKNDGPVMGFSWGFLADITIADNYFVKTGFNIDYLNGKLEYPHSQNLGTDTFPTVGVNNRKYNLRYIEVPLTLKMRTNQFGKTAYFGEIGFGTSFNLRAKSQDGFIYNNGQSSVETKKDISDEITFMKETIILGAGIEYFVDQSTSLIFGLTYNNGITNILKGENTIDPNIKQKGYLYNFQLSVGVMF
ncbi:MAG: hypothetical protein B6D61_07465 [Bacteroidetes bacterium 4484_249]|nr:MAG: hypothetical protein B6D61_07465 [Bacteroidetes bacterium 4484_249]